MVPGAAAPGLLIGAALGLLGGGGSVLTVPIFVYLLGYEPKDAIAMSLAVVGATSLAGVALHGRAGHVDVHVGGLFGAVAMAGTYAGARLGLLLPGDIQLAIFAAVVLAAAAFMARGGVAREPWPHVSGAAVPIALGGLLVGLLTGVVGVGGGFLIVPALVLLGLSMRDAIGTSLLIIAANCAVGLLGYASHVTIAWPAVALVASFTVPGMVLGAYLHRYVPPHVLRAAFSVFLFAIGTFILYENVGSALGTPLR